MPANKDLDHGRQCSGLRPGLLTIPADMVTGLLPANQQSPPHRFPVFNNRPFYFFLRHSSISKAEDTSENAIARSSSLTSAGYSIYCTNTQTRTRARAHTHTRTHTNVNTPTIQQENQPTAIFFLSIPTPSLLLSKSRATLQQH